jgi:hypothetical protein
VVFRQDGSDRLRRVYDLTTGKRVSDTGLGNIGANETIRASGCLALGSDETVRVVSTTSDGAPSALHVFGPSHEALRLAHLTLRIQLERPRGDLPARLLWSSVLSGDGVTVERFALRRSPSGAIEPAERRQFALPFDPRDVASVELDGDGRPDFVATVSDLTDAQLSRPVVVLDTVNGPLTALTRGVYGRTVAADLDGDGIDELIVAETDGEHSRLRIIPLVP